MIKKDKIQSYDDLIYFNFTHDKPRINVYVAHGKEKNCASWMTADITFFFVSQPNGKDMRV